MIKYSHIRDSKLFTCPTCKQPPGTECYPRNPVTDIEWVHTARRDVMARNPMTVAAQGPDWWKKQP